jgi:pyruvate,water dikinase
MSDGPQHNHFVYFFGAGQADGDSTIKHLLGGKGASLADMTKAHLNVPPGFTISTECCDLYFQSGKHWPPGLEEEVRTNLRRLEQLAGRTFGRGDNPLLVAVRSGAAQSMPGMMDTVLNVGLNPDCVEGMARRTGNPRGAWEAYRHFIVMFGHTVGGVGEAVLTGLIAEMLRESGKPSEADLDAGQMQTLCDRFRAAYRQNVGHDLPTEPWDMLRQAIDAVFGSWNNERAITYRKHHRIEGLLGTAVNVQMMCPSEVSGIMFTANPVNPAFEQVIIESSYGLGEAIVLGKVTPDRFVLDKRSGQVLDRAISVKDRIIATLAQDGRAQTGARDVASLNDAQLVELMRLGLRIEDYFQRPSDIEWALSQGQFYLLQARAIKGLVERGANAQSAVGTAERERIRQEEMGALAAKAEPGGTVWSRYNLSEILPAPTPMTWGIIRRFMSGRGGFGLMYRDLGFDPDPALDDEGIYDLICGRPYCNLSREPRMQFRQMPFEHPFASLKASPQKALYPQPVLNPGRGGWRFWVLLPWLLVKLVRAAGQVQRLSKSFAQRLRGEILPGFAAEAEREAAQDLSSLDTPALLQRLEQWIQRTLYDFARESLKPTALAAVAMANLERALQRALGTDRSRAALGELVMGVRPDPEADLPGAVGDLAAGRLDRDKFIQRFGHRSSQEMELAQPRWAEVPAALDQLVAQAGGQADQAKGESAEWTGVWQRIAEEAKLSDSQRAKLEREVEMLHTYLGLRETGKHYLMKGYALIRRVLVELDRRYSLNGDIFYLTPDELPHLAAGEDFSMVIGQRRRRRTVALELEVPQVLFSDDLAAIGRPAEVVGADTLQGVPLSAGAAEGPALVLNEPSAVTTPDEPYILVCPSTDPAWVPLFVHARGLVMETGGVLSHGAIVAREFGLPAVAGISDVHRRLHTGQRLRVDGSSGLVTVLPGND